jgi:hypothetical protein
MARFTFNMSLLTTLLSLSLTALSASIPFLKRQTAPTIPPLHPDSAYHTMHCGRVNDTTVPGYQRCQTAGVPDLMDDIMHNWLLQVLADTTPDDNRDFIELIYNMAHGPENNNCNVEVAGRCGAHVGCGDIEKVNAGGVRTFDTPAAWLLK